MWFFIVFMTLSLFAQTSVDSLKIELEKTKGKEKVDILNHLSKSTYKLSALDFDGDAETGLDYAAKAKNLAESLGYTRGIAEALSSEGYLLYLSGKPQEGFEKLEQSLELYNNENDRITGLAYLFISRCHNKLGRKEKSFETMKKSFMILNELGDYRDASYVANNVGWKYWRISNYDSALVYYEKALNISTTLNDTKNISKIANNIGVMYYQGGYYEKALEYYFIALRLREKEGNKSGIALTTGNIAKTYLDLGKTNEALTFFQETLAISRDIGHDYSIAYALNNIGSVHEKTGDYEKAIMYYSESLSSYESQNDQIGASRTKNSLGNLYTLLGDYEKAYNLLQSSLENARKIGNAENQAFAYYYLGNYYVKNNDAAQALNSYNQSLALSKEIKKRDLSMDNYQQIANVHAGLGDHKKAFDNLRLQYAVKDSVQAEDVLLNINRLKLSYETEKKELENKILRENNARSLVIIHRNKMIILLISIFLVSTLSLSMFLFYFYREKKKALEKNTVFLQKLEAINLKLKNEIDERKKAESQVKILSGLLPICASCKKIRDDKGDWTQLEAYIKDRSEADFSHGICPDCIKKLYPDLKCSSE